MGRHANPDIRRAFAEFQDQDTPSKVSIARSIQVSTAQAFPLSVFPISLRFFPPETS